MTLSEQVAALERRVAELEDELRIERDHKHLMIDRKDQWHAAYAVKECERADLAERLRLYENRVR